MWQQALILTNHFWHTWSLLWMSYLRISMMNMKIYHTLGFASTIMNSVWMMRMTPQHNLFHLTKQKHAMWKKRAEDGRSSDEVEHFTIPYRVTVRQRVAVAAVELRDSNV